MHTMDGSTRSAIWSEEQLHDFLIANEELATHVLIITSKRKLKLAMGKEWISLFNLPTCHFHTHVKSERCPYENNEVEELKREVSRLKKANAGLKKTIEMQSGAGKGRKTGREHRGEVQERYYLSFSDR